MNLKLIFSIVFRNRKWGLNFDYDPSPCIENFNYPKKQGWEKQKLGKRRKNQGLKNKIKMEEAKWAKKGDDEIIDAKLKNAKVSPSLLWVGPTKRQKNSHGRPLTQGTK